MSGALVTAIAIAFVVLFVALDVYLALDEKPGNTYSEILRGYGTRRPWFRILFLVAVGVLLGHWWW